MWQNRKTRFKIVMLVLAGANLYLWFSHKFLGMDIKEHGGYFVFVCLLDTGAAFGFMIMGFLTAWLLAFKPEALKQSIERSIAKQAAQRAAKLK